jgi:hypothetical protein
MIISDTCAQMAEKTNTECVEIGGLIIGEPVNLDGMFGNVEKRMEKSLPPAERVIAVYDLEGLEGNRALLRVYQDYLVSFQKDEVPYEHLPAWEILVEGRIRRDSRTASALLRWGMQRCAAVMRSERKLLREVDQAARS